jgi:hypothetical protein
MSKRKNLLSRYKQLSFWNKVAFWGSIASIISIILYFLPNQSQKVGSDKSSDSTVYQKADDIIIHNKDARLLDQNNIQRKAESSSVRLFPEKNNKTGRAGSDSSILTASQPAPASMIDKHLFNVLIDVNPDRAGAKVFVNGVRKGTVPCSLPIEEGTHQLKLEYKDPYYPLPLIYIDSIVVPPDTVILIDSDEFKAKGESL